MATLVAAHAASTYPVPGAAAKGVMQLAWGSFNITTALSQNDVIQFCRVPANATVHDGWVIAADIDTGTEAFDFDIGWLANGAENANTAGFLNSGVWTGDAITDLKPEVGVRFPFGGVLLTTGPQTFTKETIIAGLCNAAANAGGTGVISVYVYFTVPTA